MANPSSSHRDREDREDRGRDRVVRERSHHHHRTISSTTLLLILSLVLAVLAVMLSLPSARSTSTTGGTAPLENEASGAGLWGMFTPRRSQNIVAREGAVAKREADVARREADILAGALVTCGPYATVTETYETIAAPPPVQTIYKEIVKEDALTAPGAADLTRRVEELLGRESKVADREKDMSRREEAVNRREHDAQRRESWIMEQLIALGNDPQTIEEEYIYEPSGTKRRFKVPLSTPRREL
ncbi:hypothetical protein SCHPADRAFT_407024 [Schizopora paradoxa]|uniref:Uncharacterized protein n=1 Tax=Schizopora paradoxa TaxID=27342 RepID=A0A0H2S6W7_9AGAM|nr:hypothetical protein SCHPADRAFT_407024 [Schizopora paradoxa]